MSLDRLKRLLGEEPSTMDTIKPFPTTVKMARGGAAKQSVKEGLRETLTSLQQRLQGALKPSKEPVRGQTSRELVQAQRQQLTD